MSAVLDARGERALIELAGSRPAAPRPIAEIICDLTATRASLDTLYAALSDWTAAEEQRSDALAARQSRLEDEFDAAFRRATGVDWAVAERARA